ncbi:hypothetical protein AAHZ94_15810, partial [Streptomyces sp. HSW2009]|uniref:hypothetical protein n=1 Tax=Streptomyces sp. HSW2009 TaxID=3142890 RepID=UPI0032EE6012
LDTARLGTYGVRRGRAAPGGAATLPRPVGGGGGRGPGGGGGGRGGPPGPGGGGPPRGPLR